MRFHLLLSLLPMCGMFLHGADYRFPDDVAFSRFQSSGPVLSVSSPEVRDLKGSFQVKKELSPGVYLARMKYRIPGVKNVYMDCQILNMKQKPVSAGVVRFPAVPEWEETACLFRLTAPGMPSFSFYSLVFSAMPAEHYRQPGKLEVSGLSITRLESDPLFVNGDFRLGTKRPAGWWINTKDDSVFPVKATDADGSTSYTNIGSLGAHGHNMNTLFYDGHAAGIQRIGAKKNLYKFFIPWSCTGSEYQEYTN